MLGRRRVVAATSVLTLPRGVLAQGSRDAGVIGVDIAVEEFESPGLDKLDAPEPQGSNAPTEEQRRKAQEALDGTPYGPRPIDVALSFVTRYGTTDPDRISQWPKGAAWNPLVRQFFSATSLRPNDDMVDWCAAFVNWCLERNQRHKTNSAGSQSFLHDAAFVETKTPKEGDIAVFTCSDEATGNSLGIGHVGFFRRFSGTDRFDLVAGNQGGDRRSIISERSYSTLASRSNRHIGGKLVPVIFKFNRFLSVA